jgi:hypothetical protein
MVKKDDVEQFLSDFKTKLEIFDVNFLDERNKNTQALADLDITHIHRIDYLKKLKMENYLSGPNKDKLGFNLSDYWEFGMKVKKTDVYIKIRLGKPNGKVICVSFHPAERKMKYPFKKGEE